MSETAVVLAVDAEIDAYRDLFTTLRQELEALRRVDPDAIATLGPAKMCKLATIEDLSRRRVEKMQAAGIPNSRAGLRQWLAEQDPSPASVSRGNELLRLAQETLVLNALGMRLVSAQMRHFERASVALRRAAGRELTYGADGRTTQYESSHVLATI